MGSKLTNEIVDERLKKTNYKRIGDYIGTDKKSEFECLIHGTRFFVNPNSIFNKKEVCPDCQTTTRWTNELIDEELIKLGITIKRIEEYKGCNTLIKWECLKDSGQFMCRPISILDGQYPCPICGIQRHDWTNERVDAELIRLNKKIKRIGEAKHSLGKIEWQCLKCNNNFYSTVANIMRLKCDGCADCEGKLKWSLEFFLQVLKDQNKEHLELIDYPKDKRLLRTSKIKMRCKKDGYEWQTSPNQIYSGSDCPMCGGVPILTNELIDKRLIERNAPTIRIEKLENAEIPIKFQCKLCKNIWKDLARKVASSLEADCPKCFHRKLNRCEEKVKRILKEHFKFQDVEPQFPITNINILDENGETIREWIEVDFKLVINTQVYIIEYQGLQHYKPVRFSSTENPDEEFRKQQIRDNWLRNYCKENNIILIEIDYRKYKKYSDILEYLKQYF